LWTGSLDWTFIAEGGYVLCIFLAVTIFVMVWGIGGGLRLAFGREQPDHKPPQQDTL
jgi:hypothetical protein